MVVLLTTFNFPPRLAIACRCEAGNLSTKVDIRISISEAARLFGVSTKTIRQAIYNDEIRYITVRGRYKLNFKSVLAWSQRSTRRRNQLTKGGIGQFVTSWNITNTKYSPIIPPEITKNLLTGDLINEPEETEPTLELE